MIKLTPEQTEQAVQYPNGVECQADGTDRTFILMDADVLERMRRALYRKDTNESLERAIDDMEAGRMMSVDEAEDRLCDEMGFSPRPTT
ncbi:MAG: hypothetical protein ABGZ35_09075 [Planctomycetaceae bacterium]|jgi:hypothetical protein